MFNIKIAFQPDTPVENLVAANDIATLSATKHHTPNSKDNYAIVSNTAYTFVVFGELYRYDGLPINLTDIADGLHRNTLKATAYYGQYFWVLLERAGRIRLMCDPFGQYPVGYHCNQEGHYHFFSQDDTSWSTTFPRAISHEVISRYIFQGRRSVGKTAFEDINMLVPGAQYSLSVEHGMVATPIMTPALLAHRYRSPYGALALAMANKLQHHDDIVLELSGGVESTSIAAVLSRYKKIKRIRCVTYYDHQCYSSNEIARAQSVAEYFGLPLETISLNQVLPFSLPGKTIPLHLIPSVYACQFQQHHAIAQALGDNVLFISGHGGDALYMAPPPLGLFVDVLFSRGICVAARTLYHLALQHRMPLVAVLTQAWRKDYFRQLTPDDLYFSHESKISCHFSPARKTQWQDLIWTILEVMPLLNPVFTGKQLFYPFLSAPVVTQALHCPPERLAHNEFNRYALRKSVYLNTQCSAIWRTDKGDTTHNMLMGLAANAQAVNTFLREGALAAMGMIDQAQVAATLASATRGRVEGLPLVGRLFAAETLLRAAH